MRHDVLTNDDVEAAGVSTDQTCVWTGTLRADDAKRCGHRGYVRHDVLTNEDVETTGVSTDKTIGERR
jgi:hypothetical protein